MLARLSKDGLRVLCGNGNDCGAEIAWVLEHGIWTDGRWQRAVWFPPGWAAREDGVWTLTERAAKRVRRGQAPADRRQPGNIMGARAPANYGKGPTGWHPSLPAGVICPDCGFRQTLDPDVLAVAVCPTIPRELNHQDEYERWQRRYH